MRRSTSPNSRASSVVCAPTTRSPRSSAAARLARSILRPWRGTPGTVSRRHANARVPRDPYEWYRAWTKFLQSTERAWRSDARADVGGGAVAVAARDGLDVLDGVAVEA